MTKQTPSLEDLGIGLKATNKMIDNNTNYRLSYLLRESTLTYALLVLHLFKHMTHTPLEFLS